MFKTFRKNIVGLFAGLALAAIPMAVPALVSAQATQTTPTINNCLGGGSNLNLGDGTSCGAVTTTTGGAAKIQNIIVQVVNIFSAVVGIVSVIMIIFGGFKYITSNGESGNVSSAKNTIIYAVIGLVVVAMAQFIVQFVVNKITTGGTTATGV